MARIVTKTLTDDLDGTEASETVRFAIGAKGTVALRRTTRGGASAGPPIPY
jgi:hypothetical protein